MSDLQSVQACCRGTPSAPCIIWHALAFPQHAKPRVEDTRRHRNAKEVVDEREEQVLPDVAHGSLAQQARARNAAKVHLHQHDPGAAHRDVGTCAHRE